MNLKSLAQPVLGTRPVDLTSQIVGAARKDDLPGLAAEFAYRSFLAIFPFFIFVAAFSGFVTDVFNVTNPTDRIIASTGDTLPADSASVLRDQLDTVLGNTNGALLSIGALGALWAASSSMGALMKGLNRIYDVDEERPLWRSYFVRIALTLLSGSFMLAAFLALVVGQAAGVNIVRKLGVEGNYSTVFTWVRWPIAAFLIVIATGLLYGLAPNKRTPLRRIVPGAVLFSSVWLVATHGFGIYVANFASYNSTYGALGGVVILMIWFYITGLILLAGAELNAVLEERAHAVESEGRPGGPHRRDARAAEESSGGVSYGWPSPLS